MVTAFPQTTIVSEQHKVAAQFGDAAKGYTLYARLQRLAAARLVQWLPRHQQIVVDLGSGPLWYQQQLQQRCELLLAMDLSWSMLQQASQQQVPAVQADARLLPLQSASIDALFSSLMLQWCAKPELVLQQAAQALKPGGVAVFSTLLHGTLTELEQAWAAVDEYRHINEFLPLSYFQALQQQLSGSGIELELETESVQLPYLNVRELAQELKGLGANTVLGQKRQGLTGKDFWQQLELNYPRCDGTLVASYQLLYIRIRRT